MKKNKFSKITLIPIIFLFKLTACNFAPGSYPYAEEYQVKVKEATLINAIQNFKKSNSQYIVPEHLQLKDGRKDNNDIWYHVYFYYPQENQIIYCWTRPDGEVETTFGFVSINQGLILGKWKDINKDFDGSENERQKHKFEERILSQIKKGLKSN